jgi:hypothetical protein
VRPEIESVLAGIAPQRRLLLCRPSCRGIAGNRTAAPPQPRAGVSYRRGIGSLQALKAPKRSAIEVVMTANIVVPALGESVTEATVAKWMKSVGDPIKVDEPLLELETDKVTLEVFAPAAER